MSQEIKNLSEKRRKWVEANRENGFESGLKRLLTDLYPDNAHFIYELLQNAEDAQANEVRFILHEDRIEFEHDGKRLFSITDVEAITSIGFSTKRDDVTTIGKFGVGFKAVFAYTETPQVGSGEFCFKICDMVVPEPDGFLRSQSAAEQTRFILPFDNPKKSPEQARSEIEKLLKALDATTLLFLTHIRKIEYILPDSTLGCIERIGLGDDRFEISVQHPHEPTPSSSWFLKFDKDAKVEDEEAENESPKVKTCRIAVAFALNRVEAKRDAKAKSGGAGASQEWELVPMTPGRVCIYFPADKETSNLRFHIHAPFASTVARDSVRDCAGNNQLRQHLVDLLAESMSAIRNQDLLTVRALAVLPNEKDNLPKFYEPLMKRLVREFQEQDLVPMKRGGHATAVGIFRGSKALSDLIDDEDMVTLLGDDYFLPMWAANPSQRNQREDNFLSMLDIEQWDTAELVKALRGLSKDALGQWMGNKDDNWHHDLYEMLLDYINAASKYPTAAATERTSTIRSLDLVRCSDGTYRKGSDSFFLTDDFDHDDRFPRVARSVYFADKEENKKAHEFLETISVRKVDEKAEIEYILEERYSQEAVDKKQFKPEINDIACFIGFAEKHPADIGLFQDHYIFKLESGKWSKPEQVYLDAPFMDTGLNIYYQILGSEAEKWALSEKYMTGKFNLQKIGKFANNLGATCELIIEPQTIPYDHPEKDQLSDRGGWSWAYGIDEDYYSESIQFLIQQGITTESSKLIWKTMNNCDEQQLMARFRNNSNYNTKEASSSLVHMLRRAKWVPQRNGEIYEFVQPRDAIAENLPEGFDYQTGYQWLQAIEFGKRVEERQETEILEKQRQSQEYKSKEQAAKKFGFDSPEEAEEMAKLKKENPEEFRRFKESAARKERPTFLARPVANPERRQERLGEQLTDAPDKEYEKRERSVRTTTGAIDPTTWLRNQYTNEADRMVCQICKEEMPFRKRDGTHYFEKKEVLTKKYLPKEHEAQYLALCPLCAAKYDEFVKTDDEVMAELRKEIVSAADCEIPILLGDEKTSIRFVGTHYHDVKHILEEMG